jgi:hypothetical protein
VMRKSQESLERLEAAMRLANPVPNPSALADSSESLAVSRLVSRRRHAMRPEPTAPPEARHHWRGIAIAATAFVAALAIALPLWLLRGGDEPPPVATSVTTTIATTSTAAANATPEIVVASISIEDASPSIGLPLVAVSAREASLGMSPPAGTRMALIGHLEDGTWKLYRLDHPSNWITRILGLAVAPDGTAWVATNAGVFSFDGAEWTRRFDGPAGAVVVDDGGTVWIGGERTPTTPPSSIEDMPSMLWLARWDGASWERMDDASEQPSLGVAALMAVLPNGEAWIREGGREMWARPELLRYDGTTLADPPDERGFAAAAVALEAAPNGDLWAGAYCSPGEYLAPGYFPPEAPLGNGGCVPTGTGVFPPEFLNSDPAVVLGRFDDEAWTAYEAPFTDRLLDIAVGPDGVVWFASDGGLGSFDGTEWVTRIEGPSVWSVDVAPDGTVWYTDSDGVHTLSTP